MKIPVPNGGGSGSGSTECTATAEDILETKTAIYNGSGDEPEYGSMKNVDSIDPAKSITISSGVLYVRFTNGAHVQNASSGYPEVSVPQADLASAEGLTAAKIATGNSILGVDGTYTGVGTAGTAQVLSGYTFSSASLSGASGAMSDRSGTTTSATASLDSSNSRVRMQIPNSGYYNTSAYLYTSYSSMASVIGLTAAKLGTGQTCLGITGTYKPTVKEISSTSYGGSYFSQSGSDGAVSYTCPASGTCYYGGMTACYWGTSAPDITCEISKNGTVQDSRNIQSNDDPDARVTMVDKSFSVSSGDVITVNTACTTPRTFAISILQAVIVTYT